MFAYNDYPYRVFLSYARDDAQDARRLHDRLRELHLHPFWDKHNPGGWRFLDEIKKRIDRSHVFIALLTPQSVSSTWVNHEIGYAMGRNIPVLPLSLGPVPEGMTSGVQAVVREDMGALLLALTRTEIDQLVDQAQAVASYECADLAETRTPAIIEHCKQVKQLRRDREHPLRHRAAFGSFSIPSNPDDPIFRDRFDGVPYNRHRAQFLSAERRELEAYAKLFGCDLVLYPSVARLPKPATEARIQVLKSFLRDIQEARALVRVAFDERALDENLIVLGDWFFAESQTPRLSEGFRHTTITCHAPTVLKRIEEFELQFSSCSFMSPDLAIRWLDQHF
jgi:hypothetical protein